MNSGNYIPSVDHADDDKLTFGITVIRCDEKFATAPRHAGATTVPVDAKELVRPETARRLTPPDALCRYLTDDHRRGHPRFHRDSPVAGLERSRDVGTPRTVSREIRGA